MDAKRRLAAFTVEHSRTSGGGTKGALVRDNDGDHEPLRAPRGRASAGSRRLAATPEEPDTVSGSESDPDGETVDVGYIHSHRPSTKVVRNFMRIQAQAVSTAEEDDFL